METKYIIPYTWGYRYILYTCQGHHVKVRILSAIPLGTCEKVIYRLVNTENQKHVYKTVKNTEKIPDLVVT